MAITNTPTTPTPTPALPLDGNRMMGGVLGSGLAEVLKGFLRVVVRLLLHLSGGYIDVIWKRGERSYKRDESLEWKENGVEYGTKEYRISFPQ